MAATIYPCQEVQQDRERSRTTIYRMIKRGHLPKLAKLNLRVIGWRESAIDSRLERQNLANGFELQAWR